MARQNAASDPLSDWPPTVSDPGDEASFWLHRICAPLSCDRISQAVAIFLDIVVSQEHLYLPHFRYYSQKPPMRR